MLYNIQAYSPPTVYAELGDIAEHYLICTSLTPEAL